MLSNLVTLWLVQKLFPNGRAYRMPEPGNEVILYGLADGSVYGNDAGELYQTYNSPIASGGIFYRLMRALGLSVTQCYNDIGGIYSSIFPGDPNFTIEDARRWYNDLGLYDSGSVSLADMKLAIAQKQSFPFTPLNRQHVGYIQDQLRAAGFDVYVYANKFPGPLTPGEVMNNTHGRSISGYFQSGQNQYGELDATGAVTKVYNYIEEEKDADVPLELRSILYISGNPITNVATVPAARKIEFRQLILKLKAAPMCAVLFVDYT